jgi:hypothetical protein
MPRKQTEVVIDDETTASVRETTTSDGKTSKIVTYDAKVKQNETNQNDLEDEVDDFQDNGQNNFEYHQRQVDEIPKDKIDSFFDDVLEALENENDSFYIRLLRTPDNFDDDFFVRCNDMRGFGIFACYIRNRYQIAEMIQKKNNNSGGRFNFVALDRNQNPLQLYVGYHIEHGKRVPETTPIVARDVFIANPIREEIPQSGQSELALVLAKMDENRRQDNQMLIERIERLGNAKPEKTTLETMQEYKLIKELFGDGEKSSTDMDFIKDVMRQTTVMQALGQGFAGMFSQNQPQPAAMNDAEKTWWQEAIELAKDPNASEMVKAIVGQVGQVFMASQLKNTPIIDQRQPQPIVPNPQPLPPIQTPVQQMINEQPVYDIPPQTSINDIIEENDKPQENDMQKIFSEILAELEGNTPIDENNPTLIKLQAEYKLIYPALVAQVKKMSFDEAFQTLQDAAPKELIDPLFNPITEMLNERGDKVYSRLEDLYNFWKSN